jgi:hypothetical protein
MNLNKRFIFKIIVSVVYWWLLAWPLNRVITWLGFGVGQLIGLKFGQIERLLSPVLVGQQVRQSELVVNSVVFMALFLAVTLLALTTSSLALGRGIVIGLGSHYLVELLFDIRRPHLLRQKHQVPDDLNLSALQVQLLAAGFIAIWLLLSFFPYI